MLRVFICEDNKVFRERVEKIIDNIIIIENYDMKLEFATSNPYELLSEIKNKDEKSTGIYFLDIDLQSDINGIQLASEIRALDSRAFIIFITSHAEMSYLTFLYKVEAMDYIIKDEPEKIQKRIDECIRESVKRYTLNNSSDKIFTAKSNDKLISINYKNIMFFETSSTIHKVRIHSIDRQIEFYAKMKDLERELGDDFVRCHNSYLVNKDNIKEIDVPNKVLIMKNKAECLVSSRGMRLLKTK